MSFLISISFLHERILIIRRIVAACLSSTFAEVFNFIKLYGIVLNIQMK